MKKLTREEAIANHRKMWNWIADETERRQAIVSKSDYLHDTMWCDIENECFCCQYSFQESGCESCENCPLDWGSNQKLFMCENIRSYGDYKGLHIKWLDFVRGGSWRNAAKIAREIANLPERGENHQ